MIDINKVAWLAKIRLDEVEKEELFKDISKILEFFKKIQEVDISGESCKSEDFTEKCFRNEEEIETFEREKILNNFPKKEQDLLEVPKTL